VFFVPSVAYQDMMNPQITLRALSKFYKQGDEKIIAVDDVTLDVRAGDFIVITGRSGAGKTTLLSLIGRLAEPSAGTLAIDGVDLQSLDDAALSALRARKLGFVFQFASLVPTLNVFDNIRLPGLFADKLPDEKFVIELARMVGLGDKLNNRPAQLSGGQRRRVAIARALVNRPAILLADEPTGDLDVDTEKEILDLLQSLNAQGMTIILVTHSPNLLAHGNRAFRMERGRLIENHRESLIEWDSRRVLFASLS